PNKKELSISDSPHCALPLFHKLLFLDFDPNLGLKLCLLMFNKKQKRRHIKVLNTPKNDGELKNAN
ncbi:hypothetical protein EFM24_09325, partial [Limosilactobacillus fermentum]|uniref:hypothetical protein n=1 Tax=Limosilactobacillus fermentum TaxID=1613 RepID=UPI0021A40501